jgi:hypothetical protein
MKISYFTNSLYSIFQHQGLLRYAQIICEGCETCHAAPGEWPQFALPNALDSPAANVEKFRIPTPIVNSYPIGIFVSVEKLVVSLIGFRISKLDLKQEGTIMWCFTSFAVGRIGSTRLH